MPSLLRCTITVLVAFGLWVAAPSCWAGFDEGVQAYQQGNYAMAVQEFRRLADQGDAKAQYNLALMYSKGEGVPQDYAQAVGWYRRAADQGQADAQNNLGAMYSKGEGVPQDYAQAVWWYRHAADQGYTKAQFTLGSMYSKGEGVPQDYAQAVGWYRRVADQGDAVAQFNLALMYSKGEGVPQDYAQAVGWYRRAADQGDAVAQNNLGGMYDKGEGVPQDYAQAVGWYRRAADQGQANAQNNLGGMYDKGEGVPQDYAQAYFWYNLSAAHLPSDSSAIFSLGGDRAKAVQNRDRVAARLTSIQLAAAQVRARIWQPKPETSRASSILFLDVVGPVRAEPLTASPRPDLIRQVQERLQAAGFSPGAIDGSLGPQTRDALRWFQSAKGLSLTGEPDEQTLGALGVR